MEDDITLVQALDNPSFDKGRTFEGLAKVKVSRKDRHMKALDQFTKNLEEFAESLENEVLDESRRMREALEEIDESISKCNVEMTKEDFLIVKDEVDLIEYLDGLMAIVASRKNEIDKYALALDQIESKRASTLGQRLKNLVDTLVAIAHQLPDEIEHIVESETHDLNSVLTANRQSHAQLLGMLRNRQIEVEIEVRQRWEDARRFWRKLRHEKALKEFDDEIRSDIYFNPPSRYQLMLSFQQGQEERQQQRMDLVQQLQSMTVTSISVASIQQIQHQLQELNEHEIEALQDCYNRLNTLRVDLNEQSAQRIESLRFELHVYGALLLEPDRHPLLSALESGLRQPTAEMSEIWRLGGGLKMDCQSLLQDIPHREMAYDSMVQQCSERLELIICGFSLRGDLEKKGRQSWLDRLRSSLQKMRSVPRDQLKDLLTTFVDDVEEFLTIDTLNPDLVALIRRCQQEMKVELDAVMRVGKSRLTSPSSSSSMLTATAGAATTTAPTSSTATTRRTTATAALSTVNSTAMLSNTTATTAINANTTTIQEGLDPARVKQWHRQLALVFFSCDFPSWMQQALELGRSILTRQRECNQVVDEAVAQHAHPWQERIDRKLRETMEEIASFLETQANDLQAGLQNLVDFLIALAQKVEAHRKAQQNYDEATEDELWDLHEEFRLAKEDRETDFQAQCQRIRESTEPLDCRRHFQGVEQLLNTIEQSYREFHSRCCYGADKYPLRLLHEFVTYQNLVATHFGLQTGSHHKLPKMLEEVYGETYRLNRAFVDEDFQSGQEELKDGKSSGGVETPMDGSLAPTGGEGVLSSTTSSETGVSPSTVASPGLHSAVTPLVPPTTAGIPGLGVPSMTEVKSFLDSHLFPEPDLVFSSSSTTSLEGKSQEGSGKKAKSRPASKDGKGGAVSATGHELKKDVDFLEVSPDVATETQETGTTSLSTSQLGNPTHFSGRYYFAVKPIDFWSTFLKEGSFAPPSEEDEKSPTTTTTTTTSPVDPESGSSSSSSSSSSNSQQQSEVAEESLRHPDYPFFKAGSKCRPIIRREDHQEGKEEEAAAAVAVVEVSHSWTEEDWWEYEMQVAEDFIELDQASQERWLTNEDLKAGYESVKKSVEHFRQQKAQKSTPEYQRLHPPRDAADRILVRIYAFQPSDFQTWLTGLRHRILWGLEQESAQRHERAVVVTQDRKSGYTEVLEDRIRTHWPRRGRVETEVVQPREAELQGHEEKTIRHLQAMQMKMVDLQRRVEVELEVAEKKCFRYEQDMNGFTQSLVSQVFHNLATLQGIDVKARTLYLSFQQESGETQQRLGTLLFQEKEGIQAFGRDFLRLCPRQGDFTKPENETKTLSEKTVGKATSQNGAAGASSSTTPSTSTSSSSSSSSSSGGGYSPSELEEIRELIEQQCHEVEREVSSWQTRLKVLTDRQNLVAQKCHGEFTSQYEKTGLEVALAEGLGQKYGAPRRRAQERIRSELGWDEENSRKIDGILEEIQALLTEECQREQVYEREIHDRLGMKDHHRDGGGGGGGSRVAACRQKVMMVDKIWWWIDHVMESMEEMAAMASTTTTTTGSSSDPGSSELWYVAFSRREFQQAWHCFDRMDHMFHLLLHLRQGLLYRGAVLEVLLALSSSTTASTTSSSSAPSAPPPKNSKESSKATAATGAGSNPTPSSSFNTAAFQASFQSFLPALFMLDRKSLHGELDRFLQQLGDQERPESGTNPSLSTKLSFPPLSPLASPLLPLEAPLPTTSATSSVDPSLLPSCFIPSTFWEQEPQSPLPMPRRPLSEIVTDIEVSCGDETRQLYAREGKSALLEGEPQQLPSSLRSWLEESRHKILGEDGYRERSWNVLWRQVEKLEQLLGRQAATALRQQRKEDRLHSLQALENTLTTSNSNSSNSNSNKNNNKNTTTATTTTNTTTTTNNNSGSGNTTSATPSGWIPLAQLLSTPSSSTPSSSNVMLGEDPYLSGSSYITSFILHALSEGWLHLLQGVVWGSFGRYQQELKAWQAGRTTHERQLRPRLGSPDALPELLALDDQEKSRSQGLQQLVKEFRSRILIWLVQQGQGFLKEVSFTSQALLKVCDSCLRQEKLENPPGIVRPHIPLTMKRLRKLQHRLEVMKAIPDSSSSSIGSTPAATTAKEKGKEKGGKNATSATAASAVETEKDLKKSGVAQLLAQRTWPSMPITDLLTLFRQTEILIPDLAQRLAGMSAAAGGGTLGGTGGSTVPAGAGTTKAGGTGKAAAAPPAKAAPPVAAAGKKGSVSSGIEEMSSSTSLSLISEAWKENLQKESSVTSEVSTAHRLVIRDRDGVVEDLKEVMGWVVEGLKTFFQRELDQEDSWNLRWRRQVDRLKEGNL